MKGLLLSINKADTNNFDAAKTTEELVMKSQMQMLRIALDALIANVEKVYKEGKTGRNWLSGDEVFAHIALVDKLGDARDELEKLAEASSVALEHIASPIQQCRCEEKDNVYDNSKCPIHTIDHVHVNKPLCCDQPDKAHRHPTGVEYEQLYPKIFDTKFLVGDRTYRVDARRYTDGDGVTFTQVFKTDEDDEDNFGGICFDFSRDAVPQLIEALQELQRQP